MIKLKEFRKSLKLKAMELVDRARLDLNQPLMSAVESGKVLFTPDDLRAVCKAMECTPMDLFSDAKDFDLMAVQREMSGFVKLIEVKKDPRFAALPNSNPKRQFRMSDSDWNTLQTVLHQWGYSSVGQYLKKTILDTIQKSA